MSSLVGALVEANDQLLALYELASLSVDTLDESTAVLRILDRAHKLLKADALMLISDSVYSVGSSEHIDQVISANRIVSREATNSQQRVGDADFEESTLAFPSGWTTTTVSTSSGQSLPLAALRLATPFGTADQKLLDAVAKLLGGVVTTAQLHEKALSQAVIERDHSIASELAQRALPHSTPVVAGIDVFARSDPADTSGGDLYAWTVADGVLHFAMGDVAGKGLPAAITMTNVISAANACFRQFGADGPGAVLRTMDQWLCEPLSSREIFVTMVVGSFDPDSRKLRIANAGHSPVLYTHKGELRSIPAHYPPVGVLPIDGASETVVSADDGDMFLAGSDGLTEQQNPSGEMFGEERIADLVQDCLLSEAALDASELGTTLFAEVEQFGSNAPQSDDRTLLCLTFGPSK